LTTILDTDVTGTGKLENQAWMNQFCTRNIPTMFGVQFLSFLVVQLKNMTINFWQLFWARKAPA